MKPCTKTHRISSFLLAIFLCCACLFACNEAASGGSTDGGSTDGGNIGGGNTGDGNTDGGNTDGGNTDGGNTPEEDKALDPDLYDILDFVVEVEEGRDPVVLHISDTQIVDSTQQRYATRLGDTLYNYWLPSKLEDRCYGYLRELFNTVKPDLILLTGDIIYGEFDDNGTALTNFIEFMESFDIPWAPVFGNHDNESKMGVDWQCEQLENAENCLFYQNDITGNGNYMVGIAQGDKLLRTFVMMDSNGCGNPSDATKQSGHFQSAVGFADDQIRWYKTQISKIKRISPETRFTFAFHIQLSVFSEAYSAKGYTGLPINIDTLQSKQEGDFGYIGRGLKNPWDNGVYESLKALGVDSILVGHEHCNSASVVYEGIRLQYGQKCSTYDRANYVDAYGNVVGAYYSEETPIIGGTVMPMEANVGTFKNPYIYLCENAGGNIDWDNFPAEPEEPTDPDEPTEPEEPDTSLKVNGLDTNDFSLESGLTLSTVVQDGKNAYKLVASKQAKLKIKASLLSSDKFFNFSVYVPRGSDTLSGLGEFAIRYKTPTGNGYISFETTGIHGAHMPVTDAWTTFSIPLADYPNATEFSIIVPNGNTLYLADMSVEVPVEGLNLKNLSAQSELSITTATYEELNTYKITATEQGKLYIPVSLIEGKSTLVFTSYVPSSSNKLAGYGEFAIRYKMPSGNGYIDFNSSSTNALQKVVRGTWQTFSIDLSDYQSATEFSIIVPKGNVLYLMGLEIS